MEALIYQFMEYFFPLADVPEPVLAVFGFLLAFLSLYMLLSFFISLFGGFSRGR